MKWVTRQNLIAIALVGILILKMLQGKYVFGIAAGQATAICLSAMAGYFLGWFLSPQARAFRAAVAAAFVLFLLLFGLGDRGPFGWSVTYLLCIAGFWFAFAFWIGGVVRSIMRRPTTFGSAEWATLPYLKEHALIGSQGLRLGFFDGDEGQAPVHYTGDRHLLTIAPTRSGKGTTAIIPNLLTYRGSCLVIDPKGENALITASQRAQMGQEIHVVDPWGIASGGRASRFNPIDWLAKDDPDITENSMLLADALIVPEDTKDKFWIEEAKALLQGLILYVATSDYEEGHRTLARVRDLLLLDGEDMQTLFQRMLDADHHIVISTGARCLQKEEKLLANVIASAQAQTHFLDSARMRESLSASDFRFEDLKTKPMTIYLVLPVDRLGTFSRWLRLLVQQAIIVNARNLTVRPAKPILFLLDEMPSLGKLTAIHQAYALMAGFSMQLWGIAQDLGKLKEVYGEGGYESLIANSGAIAYYGSRDGISADYFSRLCGVTTVWSFSTAVARAFSYSTGKGGGSSSESTTNTDTSTATQRKLAYPDELSRLPDDKALILIDSHHPIIGTVTPWFENDELKQLGRNLHA